MTPQIRFATYRSGNGRGRVDNAHHRIARIDSSADSATDSSTVAYAVADGPPPVVRDLNLKELAVECRG